MNDTKNTNPLNIDLEKELGFDDMSLKQQRNLYIAAGQSIYRAVMIRVVKNLNDKDKEMLDAILTEGNGDRMEVFIREKIDNFDQMVEEEIALFKKEGLDFWKKMEDF